MFRSAKGVSVIDQRLAAEMHKRQIESLVKAEGIARRMNRKTDEVLDRWLIILTSHQDISMRLRTARMLWDRHLDQQTDDAADQFRAFAVWSHHEQVAVYADVIPRHWFRKVSAEIATLSLEGANDPPTRSPVKSRRVLIPRQDIGPFQGRDLRADIYTEPIAERKRRMSDEQWQRVLTEVVFPPPDPVEVERMLHTPDPVTNRSWQSRFEALSEKISDVDRLSQELIVGFSNGENLQQLKTRALPLVQGIQSSTKRIVRTEGLRLAEQVQRKSWSGLGDMMVGAQILAVLDQNTRPHHAHRNGTIYYESPGPGKKSMAELPMLPDEPNCRCWSTPVLKPPKELENDPDVAAAFRNDQGGGIPDPASYDRWFANVDRDRRVMAVGSRRYRAVEDMLAGQREPEWTDFIDTDGKLMPVPAIKSESPADRAIRKYEVGELIRQRGEQIQAIARKGFQLPGDVQPFGAPPIIPVIPPQLPPVIPPVFPPVLPPVQPPVVITPPPPPVLPPDPAPVAVLPSPPVAQPEPIPPRRFEIPPPAKTIKEAEQLAIKYNLADQVSYKKFDLSVANEMNRVIALNLQVAPQLREGLQFVGNAQERNKLWIKHKVQKAIEEVQKKVPGWVPSKDEKKMLESQYKRQANRMMPVKSDHIAQSIGQHHKIVHPYAGITINEKAAMKAGRVDELAKRNVAVGHNPIGCDTLKAVIDHEMGHQVDNLLGLFNGPGAPDKDLVEKLKGLLAPAVIEKELSIYASTTKDEIVSEAWAEYQNNPTPRKFATIVGKHIEERLSKL
jgi:hypothetical protein